MSSDLEWRYEDLKNDLAELQRAMNIEAAELRQENATLRRQLVEAQAEIATFVALRTAANKALDERADLRAKLDAVPVAAIGALYDAYAHATAGADNAAEFPEVGRWLGVLPAEE